MYDNVVEPDKLIELFYASPVYEQLDLVLDLIHWKAKELSGKPLCELSDLDILDMLNSADKLGGHKYTLLMEYRLVYREYKVLYKIDDAEADSMACKLRCVLDAYLLLFLNNLQCIEKLCNIEFDWRNWRGWYCQCDAEEGII